MFEGLASIVPEVSLQAHSAIELKLKIQTKDFIEKQTGNNTVLVGFEGFTDEKDELALLRPLLLEKSWEQIEESFFIYKFWAIYEYLVP